MVTVSCGRGAFSQEGETERRGRKGFARVATERKSHLTVFHRMIICNVTCFVSLFLFFFCSSFSCFFCQSFFFFFFTFFVFFFYVFRFFYFKKKNRIKKFLFFLFPPLLVSFYFFPCLNPLSRGSAGGGLSTSANCFLFLLFSPDFRTSLLSSVKLGLVRN